MILTCPECKSRYVVNPKALLPNGRTVRCAKCHHNWFEDKPDATVEVIPSQETKTEDTKSVPDDITDKNKKDPTAETNSTDAGSNGDDFEFPIQKPTKRKRPIPKTANLPALQNHQYGSSKFGWISLVIFITIIISSFIIFQDTISSSWPASNKLYAAIGLSETSTSLSNGTDTKEKTPINERLLIRDLSPSQENRNTVPTLIIQGNIENISKDVQVIPRLKVILLDARRQSIREWSFDPVKSSINPGELVKFETSLPSPPAGAKDISVLFTEN